MTTPRMEIVWRVLERAIDAEDWTVIEACRRLVIANQRGWRRYTCATDWNLVMAFDDAGAEASGREWLADHTECTDEREPA